MHVVWVTAGLGCDGDTIAMTAATQPSLEELVTGALPGVPRMVLHDPVLSYENGDEFLAILGRAADGRLTPFIPGHLRRRRAAGRGGCRVNSAVPAHKETSDE
jgi:hydrogenase small subunit